MDIYSSGFFANNCIHGSPNFTNSPVNNLESTMFGSYSLTYFVYVTLVQAMMLHVFLLKM